MDAAHGMGLVVLLDVVHSHISSNAEDGLAGFDLGQGSEDSYFCPGQFACEAAASLHSVWRHRWELEGPAYTSAQAECRGTAWLVSCRSCKGAHPHCSQLGGSRDMAVV